MKHLKNSLIVFAGVLIVIGVITFFIPSLTKGQKSGSAPKSAFSVWSPSSIDSVVTVISGPDPEGTSYAITSLTVANQSESDSADVLMQGIWGTGECNNFSGDEVLGPEVKVPAGATLHLSFPQPFILSNRPGATSCLRLVNRTLGFPPLAYTVVGYRF